MIGPELRQATDYERVIKKAMDENITIPEDLLPHALGQIEEIAPQAHHELVRGLLQDAAVRKRLQQAPQSILSCRRDVWCRLNKRDELHYKDGH